MRTHGIRRSLVAGVASLLVVLVVGTPAHAHDAGTQPAGPAKHRCPPLRWWGFGRWEGQASNGVYVSFTLGQSVCVFELGGWGRFPRAVHAFAMCPDKSAAGGFSPAFSGNVARGENVEEDGQLNGGRIRGRLRRNGSGRVRVAYCPGPPRYVAVRRVSRAADRLPRIHGGQWVGADANQTAMAMSVGPEAGSWFVSKVRTVFPPDYNQRVPCFVPTFASNDASFPVHTDGSITWLNYLQSFDDWPDNGAISGRFTSPTSFEGAFACNEFGHGMQPITFSMHWAAAPAR